VQLRSKAAVAEIAISQVTHDSRKVQPGALFVAIPGVATDGTLFARDAVSHGAIAGGEAKHQHRRIGLTLLGCR